MPRSLKKGPFIDLHLLKKVEESGGKRRQEAPAHLVPSFNDLS